MIYELKGNPPRHYAVKSIEELVDRMRQSDYEVFDDWQSYAERVAFRVLVDSGQRINFDSIDEFIGDLIAAGYIAKVEVQ